MDVHRWDFSTTPPPLPTRYPTTTGTSAAQHGRHARILRAVPCWRAISYANLVATAVSKQRGLCALRALRTALRRHSTTTLPAVETLNLRILLPHFARHLQREHRTGVPAPSSMNAVTQTVTRRRPQVRFGDRTRLWIAAADAAYRCARPPPSPTCICCGDAVGATPTAAINALRAPTDTHSPCVPPRTLSYTSSFSFSPLTHSLSILNNSRLFAFRGGHTEDYICLFGRPWTRLLLVHLYLELHTTIPTLFEGPPSRFLSWLFT